MPAVVVGGADTPLALLATGALYSALAPSRAEASTTTSQASVDDGRALFEANCATCHGADGKGVPDTFPPLAGDPVVTASDPAEHIRIILNGLKGKAIAGTTYQAEMPAFADQLSDQQIADIADHERTSWGNHAPLVAPHDVAVQRATK